MTIEMPGLTELAAVMGVARTGGFRAAARDMDVAATSVSNAVAGLERRLGVRLFNRTTRSVSLSDAGAQFVAAVGPALADIEAAMKNAGDRRARPSGRLRINCSAEAARRVLMPILIQFGRLYPEVRLEIVTDDHLVDIVARDCDAGVRTRDAVPSGMTSVPFGGDLGFAVVGSPAYLADHPAPERPGDLTAHQCIRTRWPSGTLYRWEFEQGGQAIVMDVAGPMTLDDPLLMREAALAGVGLAHMWEEHVRDDIVAGRLVQVLSGWTPSSPGLALYHPGRRNVPAALAALIEMLPHD